MNAATTRLHTDNAIIHALDATRVTSNTATLSSAVDTFGYRSITWLVNVGNISDDGAGLTVAAAVSESATSGGSYTAITGASHAAATTNDQKTLVIPIRLEGTSRLRYQKCTVTTASGTTTIVAPFSAIAVLSDPVLASGLPITQAASVVVSTVV